MGSLVCRITHITQRCRRTTCASQRTCAAQQNRRLAQVAAELGVEAVGKPQKPAVIAFNRGIEPENNYFGQIYTLQL